MNNRIFPLKINKIQHLSPTIYSKLNLCQLRGILIANHFPALLPTSPAAQIGIAIHKLYEQAIIGNVNSDKDIEKIWTNIIKIIENKMKKNPLESHLVPLESSARNFEVKKIIAFRTVKNMMNNQKNGKKTSYYESEKWLETDDGKIVGRIDLIKKKGNNIEITDFKTGRITNKETGDSTPKKEYKLQMRMYAALYFNQYNVWPNKLTLEGSNKQHYEVRFNPDECIQIIERAKNELDAINVLIKKGKKPDYFSQPSEESCRFCTYRPACEKYWKIGSNSNKWPIDIIGVIKKKTRLGNGFYKITISDNSNCVTIRGLSKRHRFLNTNVNKIVICNVRSDTSPDHFIETPLTTGYVLET